MGNLALLKDKPRENVKQDKKAQSEPPEEDEENIEIIEPADSSKKTPKVIGTGTLPPDGVLTKDIPDNPEKTPPLTPLTPEDLTDISRLAKLQNGIILTRKELALIFAGLPIICMICVLFMGFLIIRSISKHTKEPPIFSDISTPECKQTTQLLEQLYRDLSQKISQLEQQQTRHVQELEEAAHTCKRASTELRRYRRVQVDQEEKIREPRKE